MKRETKYLVMEHDDFCVDLWKVLCLHQQNTTTTDIGAYVE